MKAKLGLAQKNYVYCCKTKMKQNYQQWEENINNKNI